MLSNFILFLASDEVTKSVNDRANYVVKIVSLDIDYIWVHLFDKIFLHDWISLKLMFNDCLRSLYTIYLEVNFF